MYGGKTLEVTLLSRTALTNEDAYKGIWLHLRQSVDREVPAHIHQKMGVQVPTQTLLNPQDIPNWNHVWTTDG